MTTPLDALSGAALGGRVCTCAQCNRFSRMQLAGDLGTLELEMGIFL
jgi:hypothetical protein